MLTRLRIRNFKRLDDIDIELGQNVVLIGPNNSGKTTALQAIALWDIGVRRWNEKRKGKATPEKRSGVTINRRDLISIPVPGANLLWRDLHVRNMEQVEVDGKKKPKTENIRIEITVDGITAGQAWSCGLEFDYANEESFYCRPLRKGQDISDRMEVPQGVEDIRVAFLPPMSGLAAVEPKAEPGRVNVLIGEGQTAQILRNLCFQIYSQSDERIEWDAIVQEIKRLFGVTLLPPIHIAERGEITMAYEENGTKLDIASSGRGLQQTLLLLAYLYANPSTVLLLDEPDAHLEILRQRQIYKLLTDTAESQGSQIIAASHSEVVLSEAGDRDTVIAFVGKPHRMQKDSQVLKSLRDIGFDEYYLAEQKGWVLYLEGSSDLAILQAFAKVCDHRVQKHLDSPFVHYIRGNVPSVARDHFYGLREAKQDLIGVVIFDRIEKPLEFDRPLTELMWSRREIENYFCQKEVLLRWARPHPPAALFNEFRQQYMQEAIKKVSDALQTIRKLDPWSPDIKVTDDFLDPLFMEYFERQGLPCALHKSHYHRLAELVLPEELDPEVITKLDAVLDVAERARPRRD